MILSPIASQEPPRYRGLEATCVEDAALRIFGKPFPRLGRRMGVVVVNGENGCSIADLRAKAQELASKVEVY